MSLEDELQRQPSGYAGYVSTTCDRALSDTGGACITYNGVRGFTLA